MKFEQHQLLVAVTRRDQMSSIYKKYEYRLQQENTLIVCHLKPLQKRPFATLNSSQSISFLLTTPQHLYVSVLDTKEINRSAHGSDDNK